MVVGFSLELPVQGSFMLEAGFQVGLCVSILAPGMLRSVPFPACAQTRVKFSLSWHVLLGLAYVVLFEVLVKGDLQS